MTANTKSILDCNMIEKAKEILAGVKSKMTDSANYLEEDLKTYRAGKANPLVFNGVMVNYYGTPTPLPQVASVTVPDAKTILIQPWEKKMIPLIEKAIIDANIGFTPQNNGEQIRCNVPPLTEDRRKELIKKVKSAGEEAKVSVRNARKNGLDLLKKAQKEGMPEDLVKDYEQNIQKETDAFVKRIDEILAAKEKEILTV